MRAGKQYQNTSNKETCYPLPCCQRVPAYSNMIATAIYRYKTHFKLEFVSESRAKLRMFEI